mgnify:CR=1 FL=1
MPSFRSTSPEILTSGAVSFKTFNIALPKVKRTLRATTKAEKLDVLRNHGIEIADGLKLEEAFQSLKSEYIGRQLMGATVVTGAGMWALQGNLTGNGPQNSGERKRMISMGWEPNSIKNPITGKWHSYKGFEPFASLMGLTADVVYEVANQWNKIFDILLPSISYRILEMLYDSRVLINKSIYAEYKKTKGEKIYITFKKEDLIFFDSLCENFFT